jgi:hypothetical protein
MPDFHKPMRKDVHKEAPYKLKCGNRHNLPLIAVPVIAPFEGDLAVLYFQNAAVGNSNAVCIPSEVFHNTGGRFEWRLTVYDPLLMITGIK